MRDNSDDNVPPDLEQYRSYLRVLVGLQLNPRLTVKEDASEIVQQTILEAHRDIADFRGRTEAELRAWLKTIVTRNVLTLTKHYGGGKRAAGREVSLQEQLEQSSARLHRQLLADQISASKKLMKQERSEQLAVALSKLLDDERTVVVLRHFHSWSVEEIAQHLGWTQEAVAGLLRRGLKKLRNHLSEQEDDIANATGIHVDEFKSTNKIPDQAIALHQQANHLSLLRKHAQAIEVFSEAQALAPDWPFPAYQTAYNYLLMSNFTKAREYYEKTVKLSPRGFLTALIALHTLNREASGELPDGTYVVYMFLESLNHKEQKAKLVNLLVQRLPQFAPGWKEYALQCSDLTDMLDALERGLAANPDLETKGKLLLQKAFALNQKGDKRAAKSILENLAHDPNATLTTEHLAKQMLSTFEE